MANRTLTNLRAVLHDVERDIQTAEARLAQLRGHASSLRQMIRYYDSAGTLLVGGSSEDETEQTEQTEGSDAAGKPFDTKLVRNELFEILTESGRALHARDLLAVLNERNVVVNGKDPVNNVRAHLSHDPRFIPVGGGEWDLRSRRRPYRSGSEPAVSRSEPVSYRSGLVVSHSSGMKRPSSSESLSEGHVVAEGTTTEELAKVKPAAPDDPRSAHPVDEPSRLASTATEHYNQLRRGTSFL